MSNRTIKISWFILLPVAMLLALELKSPVREIQFTLCAWLLSAKIAMWLIEGRR